IPGKASTTTAVLPRNNSVWPRCGGSVAFADPIRFRVRRMGPATPGVQARCARAAAGSPAVSDTNNKSQAASNLGLSSFMPVYELALPTLMKANLPKATSYNVSSYGSLLRAALPYEPTSWWPMADTIKVMSLGPDPQTGGEAITIQVQYSDGRNATILLKP